jgi:hypothetical protein
VPVVSLEEGNRPFYTRINVDKLEMPTAVALLRTQGIVGSDSQLEALANRCGLHALTVDLAGGYIREFGSGDPTTRIMLPTQAELEQLIEKEPDAARREILRQELRLTRLAGQYIESLQKKDPAALALMQRLTIFSRQIPLDLLARLFSGDARLAITGPSLVRLDRDGIERCMRYLAHLHLIDYDSETQSAGIHPAIRDGFLKSMKGADVSIGHLTACRLINDHLKLGDSPGLSIAFEDKTLDLIEELIFQLIQLGEIGEAYSVYETRLGGYDRIGQEYGQFSRGERICTLLIDAVVAAIPARAEERHDWGERLYSLYTARYNFRRALEDRRALDDLRGAIEFAPLADPELGHVRTLQNKMIAYAQFGLYRLAAATRLEAQIATRTAEVVEWKMRAQMFSLNRAAVNLLISSGDLAAAERAVIDAARMRNDSIVTITGNYSWYDKHLFAHDRATLLVARGRLRAAERVLRRTGKDFVERLPNRRRKHPMATCCHALAEILIYQGRLAEARASLDYLDNPLGKKVAASKPGSGHHILLELAAFARNLTDPEMARHFKTGIMETDRRLRDVRCYGDSSKWIDLLVLRAQIHLALGDTEAAIRDCHIALFGTRQPIGPWSEFEKAAANEPADVGELSPASAATISHDAVIEMPETDDPRATFATEDSGMPNMLAATHPLCGYKLGEWEARTVLSRAILTKAAIASGRDGLTKEDIALRAESQIGILINLAQEQLDLVLSGNDDWRHPLIAAARTLRKELNEGQFRVQILRVSKQEQEKSMALGYNDIRRIKDVRKSIDREYKKYVGFEKAIQLAGADEEVRLRLKLEEEVAPALYRYEKEYAELLAKVPMTDRDEKATKLISELSRATDVALGKGDVSEAAKQELESVKTELANADSSPTSKLKLVITLIPGILCFEMAFDTREMIRKAWNKATEYFDRLANGG